MIWSVVGKESIETTDMLNNATIYLLRYRIEELHLNKNEVIEK